MCLRIKISLFLSVIFAGTGFSQTPNVYDILILKDKTVYNVHIKSITANSVIYTDPSAGTSLDYEQNKSEILTIILENGKVLTFSDTYGTEPVLEEPKRDGLKEHNGDNLKINFECGGEVSFLHAADNGEYEGLFSMEPFYLKYISSFFFGPVFGFQLSWFRYRDYYWDPYSYYTDVRYYHGHSSQCVVGMQAGGLLAGQKSTFLPYLTLSVCGVSYASGHSTGVSIPLELGLKQRIGASTFLNYGFVYNYSSVNDNSLNTFGMKIGISFYRQHYSILPQ
jgi:hypothetical protein